MSTVISVENLCKTYRLGTIGGGTLRADAARWWARMRGREDPHLTIGLEHQTRLEGLEFKALQNVSFDVRQGEILGIIGRNGAGKSTLLKILSRVTAPTSGEVKVKGRIAALLEVGTGFHPELTGRDNIFLNGTILGMRKAEIRKKFDEIVDFSGVEQFIDTPVKRYSSGMYVRLAFAVAAHLEPEILVLDEVLAVGDVEFQKKCLGKMKDVAGHGRTVLFVTHNMTAVRNMCSEVVFLVDGQLYAQGKTSEMASLYLQTGRKANDTGNVLEWPNPETAPGNEHIRLVHLRVIPPENEAIITIDTGAIVQIAFYNKRASINLACSIFISTVEGVLLFEAGAVLTNESNSERGIYSMELLLPSHMLNAGRYVGSLIIAENQAHTLFNIEDLVQFSVENTTTGRGNNMSVAGGFFRPLIRSTHKFVKEATATSS